MSKFTSFFAIFMIALVFMASSVIAAQCDTFTDCNSCATNNCTWCESEKVAPVCSGNTTGLTCTGTYTTDESCPNIA
eukprot:Pgem_evm1s1115